MDRDGKRGESGERVRMRVNALDVAGAQENLKAERQPSTLTFSTQANAVGGGGAADLTSGPTGQLNYHTCGASVIKDDVLGAHLCQVRNLWVYSLTEEGVGGSTMLLSV